MAKPLTHKLIRSHLAEGKMDPGEEIALKMDQSAFGPNVFGFAFGHDVNAIVRVPLSANWKRMNITRASAIFC